LFFIKNGCFLPENYIIKNAKKLDNIKVSIVQWRYDSICPASDAFELQSVLKKSQIDFTIGGHSAHDTETKKILQRAVKKLTIS
jgi:proline iminopeptidase